MNDTSLCVVKEVKDLGFYFTANLNFILVKLLLMQTPSPVY